MQRMQARTMKERTVRMQLRDGDLVDHMNSLQFWVQLCAIKEQRKFSPLQNGLSILVYKGPHASVLGYEDCKSCLSMP